VNNKKWEALPDDLKEVVLAANDTAMARSLTKWLWDDAKAVKDIKAKGKIEIIRFPKEMQQEILEKFVQKYDGHKDPFFQKVWKSQKDFMQVYNPYMDLQKVDAQVTVK
jgi:TRAP-type mannitol/chloroaromatic compound transport system substrate-binding protein